MLVLVGLVIDMALCSPPSSYSYSPFPVECPAHLALARPALGLSHHEQSWLQARDHSTKPALLEWLAQSGLEGFHAADFAHSQIRIGLAVSGGGYRAMLTGAGLLAALDGRSPTHKGSLGGLLQSSTYLTGLSGGSFLVSSFAVNGGKSILDLAAKDWNFAHSFLTPHGITHPFRDKNALNAVLGDIHGKEDAGFNVSLSDWYGRLISPQLFRGRTTLFSEVRALNEFKRGDMPLPILVSVGRQPGKLTIDASSNIYELSPFEFGSWDSSVASFTDMKYLGSSPKKCVQGFDNIGFVTAVSTTFFNGALIDILNSLPEFASKKLQNWLGSTSVDVAHVPFLGKHLNLVDGGEDGQSIPFYPLLQRERQVDMVLAFDITADTFVDSPLGTFSPSGRAMVATFERQFNSEANHTAFPWVPDDTTFIYGGLVEQPTFFGCDRNNLTSLVEGNEYPPLVVYIANSEHSYSPYANTFQMKFEQPQINGLINNGYNIMTQNNGTLDPEWRACLGCAAILRDQQRRNITPSEQCQSCFAKYCWDGRLHAKKGKGQRRDGMLNVLQK